MSRCPAMKKCWSSGWFALDALPESISPPLVPQLRDYVVAAAMQR